MNKLFLGKLSTKFPQQFEENYYAGGKKDSSWYGGMQVGDYVFPIYDRTVSKLWKVKEFIEKPNSINPGGSVRFEVVRKLKEPISIASGFARYKFFELDINMLNKSMKQTATEGIGFYEISRTSNCPTPDQINFSDVRNIYITIENPFTSVSFQENDIRILIDEKGENKIKDIQIFRNGKFSRYDILYNLYKQKNKSDQFYSINELLEFAKNDKASKKEKFLAAVIEGLKKKGAYTVTHPIALYDNLLVGRKKSYKKVEQGASEKDSADTETEDAIAEEFEDYEEYVELLNFCPNLILYGPPGTGKTYSAQKIIEAFEFERTKEERSFKQIQNEGRANFVTFHQSFSYEEFVEGLRPVISDAEEQKDEENGSELKYKVQPGILLNIADNAARSQPSTNHGNKDLSKVKDDSRIWKISLGKIGTKKYKTIFDSCIETNTIAIGWFDGEDISNWDYDKILNKLSEGLGSDDPRPTNDANSINNFVNELQEGDLVLISASLTSIRAIGMVDGPYKWKKELKGEYAHRRKVKWLNVFENPVDIRKYNGNKELSQVTLYELSSIKFLDIKALLEIDKPAEKKEQLNAVPYFLIIDEINRGNISKIFGELITLVEKDKRDRIKVKLPYSQKEFSLPSNLFLIGTMNTADRSIAILDTALRRRFVFKEIEPNTQVVREENQFVDGDLDLSVLFETVNKKITDKLDRDHRLGHSYFLEIFTLQELKIRWYYQIIPLLMEYFYNDAETISGIITESFIDKKTSQVKMIESDSEFKSALLNIK